MIISVIIPFQKGEAYLKDCLDSLKEQTNVKLEILLICDHAKEEDLKLISDYQPELSINVYYLKDKTGVAAARNLGLEKAAGDYVYFLDSDDYLYGDTLENLLTAAKERDDDITYGKKKSTWFQRSVFITMEQKKELGDAEDENDEDTTASADFVRRYQIKTDTEDPSGEEDTSDSSEDKESNEDSDTGEDEANGSEGSDSNDELDDFEKYLSPQELELLKQSRINLAYRTLVTKRKGIKNISVLNILFKRSFIEENKIRFSENLVYFSDMPFLLEALSKTQKFRKRLSAKYIKRKHNDSINFPSLSQIKDPNRFNDFIQGYYETVLRIEPGSDLRSRFDKKYISYYSRVFAPRLKRSSNDVWRNENFLLMSKVISKIGKDVIQSLKGYQRRAIKALIKKDVNKSIKIVKLHLGFRKLKKIFKSKKNLAKLLYDHSFIKKPVMDHWILFESFFGKNYSDSPKYIYEYLSKNNPGQYKMIWVIDKRSSRIPFKHTRIKRFSIRYYYYLARCKYYVFNGRQPEWVQKREGNIFLQTWHGTPLKKLVFDIVDVSSATPKYKQQVYKQSRAWDYLIAQNAFSAETFRRCFLYENKMLETGYPRNDILHSPDRDEIADRIRKKLKIPKAKKAILYAPTWRDDEYYAKGKYKFELHLNLDEMRKALGKDYVLLLRTHYFIADSLDVKSLKGFAYNLSKYDDISELYLISDILITDYSSVFFDYANLRRPMLFFTYDLEKYRDVLRGFYINIEKDVPGPLLFTTAEVVDAVKNIDQIQKEYYERYQIFYNKFCSWEDGHASKKVVESVFVR